MPEFIPNPELSSLNSHIVADQNTLQSEIAAQGREHEFESIAASIPEKHIQVDTGTLTVDALISRCKYYAEIAATNPVLAEKQATRGLSAARDIEKMRQNGLDSQTIRSNSLAAAGNRFKQLKADTQQGSEPKSNAKIEPIVSPATAQKQQPEQTIPALEKQPDKQIASFDHRVSIDPPTPTDNDLQQSESTIRDANNQYDNNEKVIARKIAIPTIVELQATDTWIEAAVELHTHAENTTEITEAVSTQPTAEPQPTEPTEKHIVDTMLIYQTAAELVPARAQEPGGDITPTGTAPDETVDYAGTTVTPASEISDPALPPVAMASVELEPVGRPLADAASDNDTEMESQETFTKFTNPNMTDPVPENPLVGAAYATEIYYEPYGAEDLTLEYDTETIDTYRRLTELTAVNVVTDTTAPEASQNSLDDPIEAAYDMPAATESMPDIETFLATQPHSEAPVSPETMRHTIAEAPVEHSFAILAEYVARPQHTTELVEITHILQHIEAALPECYNQSVEGGSALSITPEMTHNLLKLMRAIGYDKPDDALVRMVATNGTPTVLNAVAYLCQMTGDDRHELLRRAISTGSDDRDTFRLHMGRVLGNLIFGQGHVYAARV